MELYQVRYFLAVCEALNFTRAAERCNVTQPTLTRGVKKLEDELGGQLFRREHKLTHLTDLGRLMRPHLEQSYSEAEAAKEKAQGFLSLETASLDLGVMCTIGPARVIGLIAALRRALPGVALYLREATPEDLREQLWSGALDVALLAQPEALPERFDGLALYSERYMVAFPPGHRFERMNSISLADVDQETYLRRLSCEYAEHIRVSRRGVLRHKYGYHAAQRDSERLAIAFMLEYGAHVRRSCRRSRSSRGRGRRHRSRPRCCVRPCAVPSSRAIDRWSRSGR